MSDLDYRPVAHDHEAFREKALKRKGFSDAYEALEDEYALVRELMGTTKSAVSRLEAAAGRHSPSLTTLKRYARAVGCEVEIRLVPAPRPTRVSCKPIFQG